MATKNKRFRGADKRKPTTKEDTTEKSHGKDKSVEREVSPTIKFEKSPAGKTMLEMMAARLSPEAYQEMVQVVSVMGTKNKRCRSADKREPTTKEDTTDKCDGKHTSVERDGSSTKKAAFQTRCSPKRFTSMISSFGESQKKTIRELGFGGLCHFGCTVLNRILCLELVKRFNVQDRCLNIHGSRIYLNYHDVGLVFGLPDCGKDVPTEKTTTIGKHLIHWIHCNVGELEQLLRIESCDATFKRAFVLYSLTILLCPTSRNGPSTTLIPSVDDIDGAKNYNWSKLVFDWLLKEIIRYKKVILRTNNKKQKQSIGGCTFFLMVIYFHKYQLMLDEMPMKRPLLQIWTTQYVKQRIEEEKKHAQGILFQLEDTSFPSWMYSMFKHEETRFLLKQHIDNVLKPFDDALTEGKFRSIPMVDVAPATEGNVDRFRASASSKSKETVEIIHESNDPNDNEGVHVTTTIRRELPNEKDLKLLFEFCTSKERVNKKADECLVCLFGQYLTRNDIVCMKPRGWLNTMVFLLAARVFMYDEKDITGNNTRYMFSFLFVNSVIQDIDKLRKGKQKPWDLGIVSNLLRENEAKLDINIDIRQCKLIFAPVLFNEHWFCYVLDPYNKKLFVLDSMGNSNHHLVDSAMKARCEELLVILNLGLDAKHSQLEVEYVDLPKQRNCHDCGIYVLTYMDMWDGVARWNGKTMPNYSLVEISKIRRDFLCQWVLHPKNEERDKVLTDAGLLDLLSS